MNGELSSRLRDIVRELEDVGQEVDALEDRADEKGYGQEDLDEARGEGYDEGHRDLVRALLAQVSRLEDGAGLPTPVCSDVMTYDEVRKMIEKETR